MFRIPPDLEFHWSDLLCIFPKPEFEAFLRGDLSQNAFLGEAVMFAVIDDGPMKLVSYRPQELKPDSRWPIQEEPLVCQANSGETGFRIPEIRLSRTCRQAPIRARNLKVVLLESGALSTVKRAEPIAHPSLPENSRRSEESLRQLIN